MCSTKFLLCIHVCSLLAVLAEFFLREDLEGRISSVVIAITTHQALCCFWVFCGLFVSTVGEEIEMTPMMFTKGLADSGYWGEKFFGRIMTEEVQIGEGCVHKTCRAKVIYGLDPVFDSGSTCITKVRNPIAYGGKEESNLTEKNLEITRQVRVSACWPWRQSMFMIVMMINVFFSYI